MIENGRFAIKVLEDDLVHAGYWSGYVPMFDDQTRPTDAPTDVPTAVPDPCLAYDPADLGRRLQDEPDRHPGAGLRRRCRRGARHLRRRRHVVIADYQADTDMLVVRHTEHVRARRGGNCEADVAGQPLHAGQPLRRPTPPPYVFDTAGYHG